MAADHLVVQAFSPENGTHGIDQGDSPARFQAERGGLDPQVFLGTDSNKLGSAGPKQVGQLIIVQDLIHQTGRLGLLALKKGLVDQVFHFGLGLVPGLGHGFHEMVKRIRKERLFHLPVSRSEALFGKLVVGGLELADVLELGLNAQFFQAFLEEGDISADPGQAQPTQRMKDDFVAGRGQVVFPVEFRRLFNKSEGLFPGCAEVQDGASDLVRLGPAALEHVEPQEDALDAMIHLGLAQVGPDIVQGLRLGSRK